MTNPETTFALGACLGALAVLATGVVIDWLFDRKARR